MCATCNEVIKLEDAANLLEKTLVKQAAKRIKLEYTLSCRACGSYGTELS